MALRNAFDNLALEDTQKQVLEKLNEAIVEGVSQKLQTETGDFVFASGTDSGEQLVADDLSNSQYLEDKIGDGGVLTFSFSQTVQQIWVYMKAEDPTEEARVTTNLQNPSSSLGIVLSDQTPTPITVSTDIVRIFAPVGSRISVYGHFR